MGSALFLGDGTDCLLCVAVGHFGLFSQAVPAPAMVSLSSPPRDYFCKSRYLSRVKKTYCVIFSCPVADIPKSTTHRCAIRCSEIEGACECVEVCFLFILHLNRFRYL